MTSLLPGSPDLQEAQLGPLPGVVPRLGLPDEWRVLPLSSRARQSALGRLEHLGTPAEVGVVLDTAMSNAVARGAVLCAVGWAPPTDTEEAAVASAVLAVKPAGSAQAPVQLDVEAQRLAQSPGVVGEPQLGVVALPMAGQAARLAWVRELVRDGDVWQAACVQYWVPFPDADDDAVVTLALVAPQVSTGRLEALDDIAASLCFVDDEGALVAPAQTSPPDEQS